MADRNVDWTEIDRIYRMGYEVEEAIRRLRAGGHGVSNLNEAVSSLPTPTAQDSRASGAAGYSTESGRHSGTTLSDAILGAAPEGRTGTLSPLFVAWMQGIPGELISFESSEMPSRRSRPSERSRSCL